MLIHRNPLTAAAITRLAVLLTGLLAVAFIGYEGGRPPVRDFDSELMNLQSRFDARWYLQIAGSGYAFDASLPSDVQQNVVFFPAYPMAIRAAASLLGGGARAQFLSGTLISCAAFTIALFYIRAFSLQWLDPRQADSAVWLTALYPFAVFFGAIYTESLFLLAAAGAMWHARRSEHVAAAAWGVLAGLTRPNGFLVAIPMAWPAAVEIIRSRRLNLRAAVTACAPVAGLALYAAFVWRETGDPLAWARGHAAWGRSYQGFVALVADRAQIIANAGVTGYLRTLPHDALNALGALFAIATAVPVARRLGVEYAIWMLLTILPPIAAGGFISTGRFSAVLFPSFVWLASAVPQRYRAVWFVVFGLLQALCAALFYTWRPLY